MTSLKSVDAFIAQPALALVGLSRSGKKFGNLALRELKSKGYRVYPIHREATVIDGVACYRRFADLPEHVDAVLVVVPPAEAASVIKEAADAGIHHVWLQQGAESPAVLRACTELGLDTVAGECILMFAKPTSYHRVHRWVWGALGKLPAA
jgi:predicted CoA-binding protein